MLSVASGATARAASRAAGILKSIESMWVQVARRRVLSCFIIVALSLGGRLAILSRDPIPKPSVHDEFAYIFGAETFADGRLATPSHPMWRFFETYHINMQPTYASKYPPAQSAFLALGIRLFGHPWYGVLISLALMCGSICWMLQGWLPPKYALLGGVLAFLQFGLTNYWIDSYWGGAVAAIGGALVFGALPRLARHAKASTACAAAIGIAILANSRPGEGLVMTALTVAAFLWWTRGRYRLWLRPAVWVPVAIILTSTAGWMAYYNFKVTGSPTTFPYVINQQRFSAASVLWIVPPYPPRHREYRDPSMREMWESWDVGFSTRIRENPMLAVDALFATLKEMLGAGVGLTLVIFFVCAIPLVGIPRLRLALAVVALFLCASVLDKFAFAHYLAPVLGAFFVVVVFGVRLLRLTNLGRQRIGRPLVASLLALAAVLFFFDFMEKCHEHRIRFETDTTAIGFRHRVAARLALEPGLHLVLVHYAANHDFHYEIVYNTPDIDAQKIVWAFDFGPEADRPLLDYYRNRKVWMVLPDSPHQSLQAYAAD